MRAPKAPSSSSLLAYLIFISILLFLLYTILLIPTSTPKTVSKPTSNSTPCNLFNGRWVPSIQTPMYNDSCPFHRSAWNCIRNQRPHMGRINSWKWVPHQCDLPRIDPFRFLRLMRNKNVGFVGDSLNENFIVSFLCVLRVADFGAKKWKRKGAWRGAYFPQYNVTVGYHRAVLLAKYK